MVKKYKCIQGYPGCKKNTIVNYHPGTFPEYFDEKSGYRYSQKEVEKYPEFWEEVKEYEILQMKNQNGWIYSVSYDENLSYELKHHTIYRVRRVSDKEVFQVGDIVARGRNWKGWKNPACIIKSFKVRNREIEVEIQQEEASSNYSLGGFYHVEIDEDSPKYSKKDVDRVIDRLFDPELISDRSVFGDLLIRNCEKEIFKILDDDKT